MHNPIQICPQCQSPIPADAPGGLCPGCVLLGVAGPTHPSQTITANCRVSGARGARDPLDPGTHAGQPLPAASDDDRIFDRQWALTLIARALEIPQPRRIESPALPPGF